MLGELITSVVVMVIITGIIFAVAYRGRARAKKLDDIDKEIPNLARKATAQYKVKTGLDHKEADKLGQIIQLHQQQG